MVEHPIPSLEIMNKIVQLAKDNNLPSLEKIAFIGAQHKLETTATLFQAIIKLGADPKNMFFTGKCYSTCPAVELTIKKLGINVFDDPKPSDPGGYSEACTKVIKKMWKQFNKHIQERPAIEKIVILDDGGRIVEELKLMTILNYKVIVIEQTRGGLYSKGLTDHGIFPTILVAQSAAKKIIEAPLVATAILKRLEEMAANLQIKQSTCGVIGNGAIGKMVASYFASIGSTVKVYDQTVTVKNHTNINIVNNIEEIFKSCSFIFGCTGRDITEGLNFESMVGGDQVWISGSSEDKEFKSFLLAYCKSSVISADEDILFTLPSGKKITIKQGGFPFNFDKKPWNVPAVDIEITQCCLLGAVIQAATIENFGRKYIIEAQQQLNPYIQSYIVSCWGDREKEHGRSRFHHDILDMFKIPDWIIEKSGRASYIDNELLRQAFKISVDLNTLPVDHFTPDILNFMYNNATLQYKGKFPLLCNNNTSTNSKQDDGKKQEFQKLNLVVGA